MQHKWRPYALPTSCESSIYKTNLNHVIIHLYAIQEGCCSSYFLKIIQLQNYPRTDKFKTSSNLFLKKRELSTPFVRYEHSRWITRVISSWVKMWVDHSFDKTRKEITPDGRWTYKKQSRKIKVLNNRKIHVHSGPWWRWRSEDGEKGKGRWPGGMLRMTDEWILLRTVNHDWLVCTWLIYRTSSIE